MSRSRILVIDDDSVFRNLLVSLLRKDYIVFVAPDGVEGFHKASEAPPDLAIIDVQMPKWDGLQTLRAFRGHPHLRKAPVIMLTGDASRETVIAAIQAGASDYIIKTAFTREDLCRKIQRALEAVPATEMRPQLHPASPLTPAPRSPVTLTPITTARQASEPSAAEPEPVGVLVQPATASSVQAVLDAWE
jgi:CheY-like chemotaxis protein